MLLRFFAFKSCKFKQIMLKRTIEQWGKTCSLGFRPLKAIMKWPWSILSNVPTPIFSRTHFLQPPFPPCPLQLGCRSNLSSGTGFLCSVAHIGAAAPRPTMAFPSSNHSLFCKHTVTIRWARHWRLEAGDGQAAHVCPTVCHCCSSLKKVRIAEIKWNTLYVKKNTGILRSGWP